jgi:hypothetical protein
MATLRFAAWTTLLLAAIIRPATACADMPDRRLTPGVVADANAAVVCAYDYAKTHRHVPYPVRDAVYREYGIPRGTRASSPRRGYVIDHLIPIEVGGSNAIGNLWPERRSDAKLKDRVENALHGAVCVDHTMTLRAAQAAMARDWHTAVSPEIR